jgi:hypothetical protein
MAHGIIIDRDGNPVADHDIVPDGATLRVPMSFMDRAALAALHKAYPDGGAPLHDGMGNPAGFKPGFAYRGHVPFAHHERAGHARQAYLDALTQAWKNPPAEIKPPAPKPSPPPPQRAGDGHRVWQNYVANLSTAWKNPT